jgi:pimeloyl-ACP methyl ester carboxylesterase
MSAKSKSIPDKDAIYQINMNGLKGRVLHLKSTGAQQDILLLYGHHACIERMRGIADYLHQFGNVTMPDMPGFGGMDSFSKIGLETSLDSYADYLAAFIKLKFRAKKITIAAMSFSFLVVTRMLHKYPELQKKVRLLISIVGFSHYEDFSFSRRRRISYLMAAKIFSYRYPALFFRNIILHPYSIKLLYTKTYNARHKFIDLSDEERQKALNFEVHLWRINDIRTHMRTSAIMMRVDNCNNRIPLPVWHIQVSQDQYFDKDVVVQHLNIIFDDCTVVTAKLNNHAPSIIATKKDAARLIPIKMRNKLKQMNAA